MRKTKIIFFDADGTIWKSDKNRKNPRLNKEIISFLKKAKIKGIKCIVISYQTNPLKFVSKIKIRNLLRKFKINNYFQYIIIVNRKDKFKTRKILNKLEEEKISKKEAIMIGDKYKWDYLPAKSAEIKGFITDKTEAKKAGIKSYTFKEISKTI